MLRTLFWVMAGIGLGVIVHLVVILTLPTLAQTNIWTRISQYDNVEKVVVLEEISGQSENDLHLDPELVYGVCRLDLSKGVGVVNARLPDGFWSVSVFDALGRAVYGTTNRSGVAQILQLGIFNPEQTKLLASQQLDIAEGLLIVEAEIDDVFVVIRLAPPHSAMRARYERALEQVMCTHS